MGGPFIGWIVAAAAATVVFLCWQRWHKFYWWQVCKILKGAPGVRGQQLWPFLRGAGADAISGTRSLCSSRHKIYWSIAKCRILMIFLFHKSMYQLFKFYTVQCQEREMLLITDFNVKDCVPGGKITVRGSILFFVLSTKHYGDTKWSSWWWWFGKQMKAKKTTTKKRRCLIWFTKDDHHQQRRDGLDTWRKNNQWATNSES